MKSLVQIPIISQLAIQAILSVQVKTLNLTNNFFFLVLLHNFYQNFFDIFLERCWNFGIILGKLINNFVGKQEELVTVIQSSGDKTIKMRVAQSQNTGGNGERYFEMKDKSIQVVVEKYNSDLLVQDIQIKLLPYKVKKNRQQQFKKVQQMKNEGLGTKTCLINY
ncbi:unnamed protein product [Paramecium pentaurelia]|uniref:Uncharacterized protein n=1 Tax=Paramecium pentaurelia TaxID=43138 RepID=A0A8S1YIA9_9CILI|nr:unnamed protein product [Paramecium pentaurelia]